MTDLLGRIVPELKHSDTETPGVFQIANSPHGFLHKWSKASEDEVGGDFLYPGLIGPQLCAEGFLGSWVWDDDFVGVYHLWKGKGRYWDALVKAWWLSLLESIGLYGEYVPEQLRVHCFCTAANRPLWDLRCPTALLPPRGSRCLDTCCDYCGRLEGSCLIYTTFSGLNAASGIAVPHAALDRGTHLSCSLLTAWSDGKVLSVIRRNLYWLLRPES